MKRPADHLESYLERTLDIPNARPDLLQADAKKRYIKSGVCGAFALANYYATTKNYLPSIQPEAHIANSVAMIGGVGLAVVYGMTGVFQRFRADELSFRALEQQLAEQDEDH